MIWYDINRRNSLLESFVDLNFPQRLLFFPTTIEEKQQPTQRSKISQMKQQVFLQGHKTNDEAREQPNV